VAVQPPPIGEPAHVSGDPEGPALYTAMRFTAPFNVIGYPAISVPAGSDEDGLPFGLQVIGKPNNDGQLLDIAQLLEGAFSALPL
jgi:aspartyl-tRNA(Asn)/glutamyl-tRNA(Gln) amidotransferase subunit A